MGDMNNGNSIGLQKPFKLSVITQFYPPDYAATGQLIEELVTHLKHQGMHIKVFTGQPGYVYQTDFAQPIERLDNLQIRRSRAATLWPQRVRGKAISGLLFCLRSGLHLLRKSARGDVLLLTTAPPYLLLLGYLANRCFGLPYVCLMYDLYPDVAVQLNVVPTQHWLVRCWEFINTCVWKRAKQIIVLSPTMKERIATKCPEVVEKISVIHSWANPDWIVPISKQHNWFVKKYKLTDTFNVLYSGNMGRCHDLDTIVEAAQQLQQESIRFVFVGDGAKRQPCIDKITSLGLKNCLFLPYQAKQLLPYSLTACDLSLVSISPGMEGIVAPSKLYGILAAGRPVGVICEEHSYLRQLVADARCGQAFDNGDGTGLAEFIRRLAHGTLLATLMGKLGRRYLQSNFTPEIISQQYAQLLNPSAQPALNKQGSRANQRQEALV